MPSFPALFAPASLKPIENGRHLRRQSLFSGAFCAGLIEAKNISFILFEEIVSFPALFAPASLKREEREGHRRGPQQFSGAFCAGLIEALPLSSR